MKKIIIGIVSIFLLASCGKTAEYDYSNVSSSTDGQQTIQPVVIEKIEETKNISPEEENINIITPSES